MSVQVQQSPKRSNPLTSCFFLRSKATRNQFRQPEKPIDTEMGVSKEAENVEESTMVISDDGGYDRDRSWVLALQKSVKMLHFGRWEEREAAAGEMKRLAAEGLERRRAMAELGVIPPLVAMVGSEVAARRGLAVLALIELACGSYTNKALMVEAGLLSRFPKNIVVLQETEKQEIAKLLMSLSALAKSKFSLNSSNIIPTIVSILESSSSIDTKDSCLTTLHNLSSVLDNAGSLSSNGVVDNLISLSSIKEPSEKALSTLANLVVTLSGKKAMEQSPMVPERFIEIMTWEEKPKCQELSAYILMVLAHQSPSQRQKMSEAGIVQVLLGVVLLGTPLGQKRALKILQWFKDERRTRLVSHSGPQAQRVLISSPVSKRDGEDGKMLMKRIVKQSLYKNMETITRRANGDEDPLKLKALVISSSSKSLPY